MSFAETAQRVRPRLLKFIRSRVPTAEDAEDVLQEVMAELARMVDPVDEVVAWLYRVARNRIIDRYRKKRVEPVLADDSDRFPLAEWIPDAQGTPEDELLRGLVWEELWEALGELPPDQRDVFVWHELDGQSFKEMSERTGEKVATLISRKRYAVLFLRKRLADLYALLAARS